MTLVGAIFGLVGQSVHGWLSGAGDEAVTIELLADGGPLATGRLDDGRAALSLPADARSFSIAVPTDLGSVSRIEAYARGRLFAVLNLGVQAQAYAGAVETVDAGRVKGWAVDLARPGRPVTLDVFFVGLWVGAVRTDVERPDVADRFGAGQPCGFVYRTPAFLRTGTTGLLRLFVANTSIELSRSPTTLGDGARPLGPA